MNLTATRGTTITLQALFEATPVDPLLRIIDPDDIQVVEVTPTASAPGSLLYEYAWAIPSTATLGQYLSQWDAEVNGFTVQDFEWIVVRSRLFADVDELAAYLQRSFSPAEETTAELLLEIASGTIRDYTLQTIDLVEGDELALVGANGRRLWLPERPVLDVASVTVDGQLTPATAYRWTSEGELGLLPWEWSVNTSGASGHWGGPHATVTVVYSHGYAVTPPAIKGVCLALAARGMAAPDAGAVTQTSLGSFSESYSREAAMTLTAAEERKLRRYRRHSDTLAVAR